MSENFLNWTKNPKQTNLIFAFKLSFPIAERSGPVFEQT